MTQLGLASQAGSQGLWQQASWVGKRHGRRPVRRVEDAVCQAWVLLSVANGCTCAWRGQTMATVITTSVYGGAGLVPAPPVVHRVRRGAASRIEGPGVGVQPEAVAPGRRSGGQVVDAAEAVRRGRRVGAAGVPLCVGRIRRRRDRGDAPTALGADPRLTEMRRTHTGGELQGDRAARRCR